MATIAKALNIKEAWGVYALYIMVAGAGAVTPALAAFGSAFPDADPVTISLIQSLPSLTTILGTLLVGAVAGKKISFKVTGIVALVIYLIFGCLPAIWNDTLTSILIARACVGFGMGMVSPLGAAVFLRLVNDKEERSKYLGRGGAMQQAGCVVLTLLGGFLCGIDWRLTFWAYGLALVALVIFVVCFKEPPSLESEAKASGENVAQAEKSHIPGTAWFFIIIFLLAQLVCSPTMMNFSTLMATKIPGEDPMTVAGIAGTLLSLFVLAGVVSSFLMDKLVNVFGRFTGAVALVITLIGNIIIAFATSVAMFTIGIFVFGFGWCLVIPVINLECGNVTNKAGLAMVASLVMVAMNLGNFLASYYMGGVFSIFGPDPTTCLIVDSVGFGILAIIWAVFNMRNKAWSKNEYPSVDTSSEPEADTTL